VVSTYLDDWLSSSHCTATLLLTSVCLSVCLSVTHLWRCLSRRRPRSQILLRSSCSGKTECTRRLHRHQGLFEGKIRKWRTTQRRKKGKKERQTGKIRRVRDSRDTGGRAKDALSSFLHPSPQRLFRGEKDEICSYLRLSSWRTMAQRGTGLHLLSRSPLCPSASPSSRCLEEERHSPNLWHSSRICSGAGGVNNKYE
jgi:hypothetical protein